MVPAIFKKKTILALGAVLLIAGCGGGTATSATHHASPAPSANPAQTHSAPSAEIVAHRMHLDKAGGYAAYNAATDPNQMLGRQGEYTSKINWGDDTTGGSVEVFANSADAQSRLAYLKGFQPPFGDGYDYLTGTALLRVFAGYTPGQASALHTAFAQASG